MLKDNSVVSPEEYIQIQSFLFHESALIDSWQLDEWLALYTEDSEYQVPPTDLDESATPDNSLFYIADDRARLEERIIRLNKKTAHSEWPRSRVRHLVTNVRVLSREGDELVVDAAFACYRTKDGVTDVFMGRYDYVLRVVDGALRIRKKRCLLDLDGLRPHGRISIIL